LTRFDPLWNELFPAEQARIVQSVVERLDITAGAPTSACGCKG
jgi:site-specific DNA recombinase